MGRADHLLWYGRVLWSMGRLVNRTVSLRVTQATVRRRLETRDERFLSLARRYIFDSPPGPYNQLLRHAGCEYGDLVGMVRQRGLDVTLEHLRDEGVYLSFEEFKGRTDVVRGGRSWRFSEHDFDNPFLRVAVETRTGGSRSRGSPVSVGLRFLEENVTPGIHGTLLAMDALRLPVVLWSPGASAVSAFLALVHVGSPPVRWFTMHDLDEPSVSPRTRLMPRVARTLARWRGVRLPLPEFNPVTQVEPVLATLRGLRARRGGCVLFTSPSTAVRLAALARDRGEGLSGVRFITTMEPLTPGKLGEIETSGARAGSLYGFTEGGMAGIPCGDPQGPDDMHLLFYDLATISHRRTIPEVGELNAYMFTSLSTLPPKIMLNVESDDFGELTTRRCRCPLDGWGLYQHLASVRSFTKLTGEGSTILGTDCVHILEEILPREFGGRSIDYQLLEVEDEDHLTRLYLLVSPDLGALDEARLLQRFIEEIRARTSQGLRMWRQAETIRVTRRHPVATPRGKILPFHTQGLAAFMAVGSADLAALATPHPAGRPT